MDYSVIGAFRPDNEVVCIYTIVLFVSTEWYSSVIEPDRHCPGSGNWRGRPERSAGSASSSFMFTEQTSGGHLHPSLIWSESYYYHDKCI